MNAAEERGGYRVPGAGYGLRTGGDPHALVGGARARRWPCGCAPQPQEHRPQSPPPVASAPAPADDATKGAAPRASQSREAPILEPMECRPAARRAPWRAHPREARRAHRRAAAGAIAPRIDSRSVDVPRRRDRRARRHAGARRERDASCRRGLAATRQSRTSRSITGLATDCRPGASSNAATRRRTKRVVPSSCCGGATMAGTC